MFVSWQQFAILRAPLPAIEKELLVFAGLLLLSSRTRETMRRIPGVAMIV